MSRSLVVAVHARVRYFLVECDLLGDRYIVAVVDDGCPVVVFGAYCHCSVEGYQEDLVVVQLLM